MPSRPTCCVFIATSLDGFIAKKDGAIDWLKTVEREGEDYGYAEFAASIDTLIVGRGTYDTVLGFDAWPWDGKNVVVATHRPTRPKKNELFASGDPATLLRAIPSAKRCYVDGGKLIQQFLAAGLIDELTLSVLPILLGEGIPLFGASAERRFQLLSSSSFPSGLVQSKYRAS
jgi:dihydrofolate reductase